MKCILVLLCYRIMLTSPMYHIDIFVHITCINQAEYIVLTDYSNSSDIQSKNI